MGTDRILALGASTKAFNRRGRRGLAEIAEKCLGPKIFYANSASSLRPLRLKAFAILLTALISAIPALPQATHTTVRHHKVEDQDPAAAWLTQAEADIERQDYAGAEPALKKYLDAYPDSYSAWYDLGYVYRGLGRKDEAIAAYRKSVAAKSDVFESNLNLGLALADTKQADAEDFLRAATKLKPSGNAAAGHKRAWMALGHLLDTSKPNDAVAAYQQAARLDAKDPEPHLLAGSLLEKDQPAEAESEYKQTLAVVPDNSDALTALTNLYMRQKRFPDAESLLRKLAAVSPNDAGVHLQLGRMLIIADKKEEAAAQLEAGLKLDPNDGKAQRDLADLYSDIGKPAEAQQAYTTLLSSHPDDAGLHHGLGRVLLKQKKYLDAEQELVKAVQLQPNLGDAYGDLAIAASENKDYAMTIKAMDLRAKYVPETPISYFFRATAYDHLHDSKQAAKYYHQFLESAAGKFPDQEWQATHRLIAIEPKK
jgi:tetratricopeptide (TPR) repeat protein